MAQSTCWPLAYFLSAAEIFALRVGAIFGKFPLPKIPKFMQDFLEQILSVISFLGIKSSHRTLWRICRDDSDPFSGFRQSF